MTEIALNVGVQAIKRNGAMQAFSGLFYLKQQGGPPLLIKARDNTHYKIQLEGVELNGPQQRIKGKVIFLKRRGNDLHLMLEDKVVLDLVDFFAVQGASLAGSEWSVLGNQGLVVTPEAGSVTAESIKEAELLNPPPSKLQLSGWIGAGFALLGGGGGGGGAVPVPAEVFESLTSVTGNVVLGPVIAGNDLVVRAYDTNGKLISESAVSYNGSYTINLGNYVGQVILKIQSQGPANDYRDEATGSNVNLVDPVLSVIWVGSSKTTNSTVTRSFNLNVNPLTTLMARLAGIAADGTGETNETKINRASATVAEIFGLSTTDLLALNPTAVNDANWRTVVAGSPAAAYGAALAAISGMQQMTAGKNLSDALQKILDGITLSKDASGTATLSESVTSALIAGAVLIQEQGYLGPSVVTSVVNRFAPAAEAASQSLAANETLRAVDISTITPAMWTFLTRTHVKYLSPQQVAALSEDQLHALSSAQFLGLGDIFYYGDVPRVESLTAAQLSTLSLAQLGVFNRFSNSSLRTMADAGKFVALQPEQVGGLANAISYLTASQIASFTPLQLSGLTADQALQVNALGGLAELKPVQILALTPGALSYVPANVINQLNAQDINQLSSAQLGALTQPQAQALNAVGAFNDLTPSQFVALSSDAIGSAPVAIIAKLGVDNFAWTSLNSAQLRGLSPQQVAQFDVALIATLTGSQVYTIAQADGFSSFPAAKILFFLPLTLSSLPPQVMARLSADQTAQLSNAQISYITDGQAEAMAASGALAGLSASQVLAFAGNAFDRIPAAVFAQFTESDVSQLSLSQLAAMTASQAQVIQAYFIYLSNQQVSFLSAEAINYLPLDRFNTLTASQISAISAVTLSGLNAQHVKAMADDGRLFELSSNAFSNLSGEALISLTAQQVASLKDEQLSVMTESQARALTQAAGGSLLVSLAPAQVLKLSSFAISFLPLSVLEQLTASQVSELASTQLRAITGIQLGDLIDKALHTSLKSTQVSSLDQVAMGALTAIQFSKFSAAQLQGITQGQGRAVASSHGFDNLQASQVLALSPYVLPEVPATVVARLGAADVASLSNEQLAVITAAQAERLNASGGFDQLMSTQILSLSAQAIPNVSSAVMLKLSAAEVALLNSGQLAALTPAHLFNYASHAKLTALSGTQIALTGANIQGLSAAQLAALTDLQLTPLTGIQLNALATDGDLANLTAHQVGLLTQIGRLTAVNVARFSPAQLSGLVENQAIEISNNDGFANFTPAQVKGLPAHAISYIPNAVLALFTATDLAVFSDSQLEKLTSSQVQQLGKIRVLTDLSVTQIQAIGRDIAGLSTPDVQALSDVQLEALTDIQIAALNQSYPSKLSDLPPSRLGLLDITPDAVDKVFVRDAIGIRNKTLNIGDEVRIVVQMKADAYVETPSTALAPELQIQLGARMVNAGFRPEFSSGKNLVFTYTIVSGDSAAGGIAIPENPILLNGSYIRDNVGGYQSFTASAQVNANTEFLVDTSAPPELGSAQLVNDTGIADDGLTSDGTFQVTGVEAGAYLQLKFGSSAWEDVNAAATIANGGTTDFVLRYGLYEKDTVQIRQVDAAGNYSTPIMLTWTNAGTLFVETGKPGFSTWPEVSVLENQPTTDVVYTTQAGKSSNSGITGHDTWPLTYSLGGADADLFTFDTTARELRFKQSPNFEQPQDQGADNIYDVTITATDEIGNATTQNVKVTVTNLNEAGDSSIAVGTNKWALLSPQNIGGKWYYQIDKNRDGQITQDDRFTYNELEFYSALNTAGTGLSYGARVDETSRYYRQFLDYATNHTAKLTMRLPTQAELAGLLAALADEDKTYWTATPPTAVTTDHNLYVTNIATGASTVSSGTDLFYLLVQVL